MDQQQQLDIEAGARRAAEALHAHHGKMRDLVAVEATVQLAVTFKRIPLPRTGPPRFAMLPYGCGTATPALLQDSSAGAADESSGVAVGVPVVGPSVCLIVKDGTAKETKLKLLARGVRLARVVGFRKLGGECCSFERRRALLHRYDIMLADERVVPMLPKILGKRFFDAKRLPVPVRVAGLTPAKITRVTGAAMFRIPSGTYVALNIGSVADLTADQLVANTTAAVAAVIAAQPADMSGTENIQTLGLRLARTPVLPFYSSLPTAAAVAKTEPAMVVAEPEKIHEEAIAV